MKTAAPWLSSLLLHSMFLVGIVVISQTPAKLPKQLTLDFNLIPQVVEEVTPAVEAASPVVESVPVQKTPPPPPEVKPVPVEPPPPPPKIVEMVEPPPPVIEEVVPEVVPEPEPVAPAAVVETEVPVETAVVVPPAQTVDPPVQTVAPAVVVDDAAVRAAAEAAQHEITVNHIRGEVLGRLNYPAVARRMGWCGKLILGFVLCADGSVEDLQVLESSGHKILARAAMLAVTANVPFSGGYPRTEVRLPINFQLN